jgi:hypothetical protein
MTDQPLFDVDTPGVTVPAPLPEDKQEWPYAPVRLRAIADYLRPLLRAGVTPLDVASAILDVDAEAMKAAEPKPEVSTLDAEQTAKWLAAMGAHPRYADGRWTMLLETTGNVDHALAEAKRKMSVPSAEVAGMLDAAAAFLHRWHDEG